MPARTSPIWTLAPDAFAALIARSRTVTEALAAFGLANRGHNHRTLRRRVDEDGLSTAHWDGKRVSGEKRALPLAAQLRAGAPIRTSTFKRRLIAAGLLRETCATCGLGPSWNGASLTLQLDHVNGDRADNRLENLRLLCPNCHSQTDTFAGRSGRTRVLPPGKARCPDCGGLCSQGAARCRPCSDRRRRA